MAAPVVRADAFCAWTASAGGRDALGESAEASVEHRLPRVAMAGSAREHGVDLSEECRAERVQGRREHVRLADAIGE